MGEKNAATVGEPPVNLLWTSGWDSTFRLLMLVLEERRPVQPYYVLDRGRPSAEIELETQERIRAAIADRDPGAAGLIGPAVVIEESNIAEDPEISGKYKRLADQFWIGGQYDFLPRLAKQHGIDELELTVHVDDRLFTHVRSDVEQTGDSYRLKTDLTSPDLEIFRCFSFPVLMLTKLDMAAIARKKGFRDILEMTWFCHWPENGRPCGRCNPCTYTIKEGLAWRIPIRKRVKRQLARVKRLLIRITPARFRPSAA